MKKNKKLTAKMLSWHSRMDELAESFSEESNDDFPETVAINGQSFTVRADIR